MAKYCERCEHEAERRLYPKPEFRQSRSQAKAVARISPLASVIVAASFWCSHALLVQTIRGDGLLAIAIGPFAWLVQ